MDVTLVQFRGMTKVITLGVVTKWLEYDTINLDCDDATVSAYNSGSSLFIQLIRFFLLFF